MYIASLRQILCVNCRSAVLGGLIPRRLQLLEVAQFNSVMTKLRNMVYFRPNTEKYSKFPNLGKDNRCFPGVENTMWLEAHSK